MNSLPSFSSVNWYWEIIKRRWLPASIVFWTVLTLGMVVTSLRKDLYEAEAKLKFKNNTVSSSLTEVNRIIGQKSAVVEQNSIDTEAEVLRSVPLIKKTIDDLQLKPKKSAEEKMSVSSFLNRLKVDPITSTDILKVSYISQDPEQAAKVVNTLVKNYLENNLVVNKAEAVTARKFLEEQLPEVEEVLQKTEAEIRKIKESNELVAPQEDTLALIQGIQELQAEIARAKGEMANVNSQAQYIKDKLGLNAQQAVILTTISQSPEIRETIDKLQSAESDLAIAKARFTPDNSKVIELQKRVASLKEVLEKQTVSVGGEQARNMIENIVTRKIPQESLGELIELEASNFGLQRQIERLSEIEQSRQNKIKRVPEVEQQLSKLSRQLESFRSTYNILWQQLETVKIAESREPGNVRVVSNAVIPDTPISSRSMGYLVSAFVALLAATGVICLLEVSDRSIKTFEEAKQLYGYAWLGVIPSLNKLKPLSLPETDRDSAIPIIVVRDYPSLPLSESYRMLQSNIKFVNSGRAIKSIVITSSTSQEGTSTVSANLAASMAQVGNKVLLVDSNLHNPIQHRIWNTYNDNGLTNVIAEQIDPRISLQKVMPNLDLLTSGTIAPSAATLLDSQRMRMLIDYWSESYDYVIFDTPSLDLTADAPIMGRMTDGVLLVVRPGSVDRSQAVFTKEILARSGLNILGIVFNGVAPQFDWRSYHYNPLKREDRVVQTNRLPKARVSHDEEMWQTISILARETQTNRLDLNLNEDELNLAPLNKLEVMVFHLQQELFNLTRLVKEQEEELLMQHQKVNKLQRQVKIASKKELLDLENKLKQEQESKRMLDETLVGQRRNLDKRREMLYQYQQVLETRKKRVL
jgi:capsular exopolysaccharide synthesis family protein